MKKENDMAKKNSKNKESEISKEKREFLKKFGQYALAGAGMSVLLSPTKASAVVSET